MTRKSENRLRRDAVLKQAQDQNIKGGYDILNDMYQQQCGLFEQYGKMAALIGHKEISPFVVDVPRVESLMKGLEVDAGNLLDQVTQLSLGHAGKTGYGNPQDENEYFSIMQMQQQYIVHMGVHQQNLLPIMFELDEHLKAAINNKQAIQAQAIQAAQTQQVEPAGGTFATRVENGMTVRADGQSWTEANMHQTPATTAPWDEANPPVAEGEQVGNVYDNLQVKP